MVLGHFLVMQLLVSPFAPQLGSLLSAQVLNLG